MKSIRLAIIGAGPYCTYAMERLAALLPQAELRDQLTIYIFERTGHFGSGATHSESQANSSYMNRVASQIGFASDESNTDSTQLLPVSLRPTFFEWANAKYKETRDDRFNVRATDIPRRYLHGVALRERFDLYIKLLSEIPNVTVSLYTAEVTDISPSDDLSAFRIHINNSYESFMSADHILLVTGHSKNRPAPGSLEARLSEHAHANPPARYIAHPYPLEQHVTEESVAPGCSVAVRGMGLTAIDVLLHLTEGRGGNFRRNDESNPSLGLRYVPGGREPHLIVVVGPSGMFTFCRPNNQKAMDGSGAEHSAFEHQPVFLTVKAIETLRLTVGQSAFLQQGEVRQLDFELHVFPLLILEMAWVYYTSLFGKEFGTELQHAVASTYRTFLDHGCSARDEGIERLLRPIERCIDQVVVYIRLSERGREIPTALKRFDNQRVLESFWLTVYGDANNRKHSPWGHSTDVNDHRFDWRKLFYPMDTKDASDNGNWQERLVSFMKQDHLFAAQGNLWNPTKAASDAVWRDLRSVLSEAVDFGGLTARSQKSFADIYWRIYNRMSNGIGLQAMEKVLALIEAKLVDVSLGPNTSIASVPDEPLFRLTGAVTKAQKLVNVVIQGRADPFDAELDVYQLYPNMLQRGIIRRWRNAGRRSADDFLPGALDLSRSFHPVQSDGTIESRITILGAPAEGIAYFQLSAARPRSNSSVLNNVARWANEFITTITIPVNQSTTQHGRVDSH